MQHLGRGFNQALSRLQLGVAHIGASGQFACGCVAANHNVCASLATGGAVCSDAPMHIDVAKVCQQSDLTGLGCRCIDHAKLLHMAAHARHHIDQGRSLHQHLTALRLDDGIGIVGNRRADIGRRDF